MYCVYRHIRTDTDEVFYVGMGGKYRPKSKSSRNKHWQRIVDKNDGKFVSEILMDNLTFDQAVEKEQEFINLYGLKCLGEGTLCNFKNDGNKCSPEVKEKLKGSKPWVSEMNRRLKTGKRKPKTS